MSDLEAGIDAFLAGEPFAVVGASSNRAKYGNKVLRCYLQHGRAAHPVHPFETEVEGRKAWKSLSALQEGLGKPVHAISIITPPPVTERIIEEAGKLGIRHVWMQPGAESGAAIARAEELGMNVIAGGACVLVVLGYREHAPVPPA
ncbi:MAG: CoA-binding protein [Phycisphaerales bacterium]